ncbi:MAG: V-type ATP synthase subunit E [Candidatus Heimdallarchaeaceae archaeon]
MREKMPEEVAIDTRVKRLVDKIYKEAKAEVEKIKQQTKQELEAFEKETARLVEETKKQEIEKEQYRINLQKRRIEANKEQEARTILLKTQEQLIDQVLDEVIKAMKDFRKLPTYKRFLEQRLKKLSKMIHEPKVRLLVDKRDKEMIEKIVKKLEKETEQIFILEPTLETLGGFVLTDLKERIRIEATIEYIFKVRQEAIRSQINQLLFGDAGIK